MYSVSNGFKTAIAQLDRKMNAYVVIDGTTYNSDSVISVNYSHGVLGDRFEVGQVPSAYCEIKLKDVGQIVDNREVQVYVGVQVDGIFQYVPLGAFIVDESSRSLNELTIHCQDKMVQLEQEYVSTLTYPAQLSAVLDEVLAGFTKSITLPSYLTNYTVPKVVKRTRRQVLGYIAAICGAFAYVDRDGVFRFKVNAVNPDVSYVQTVSGDNYFKFNREDIQYKVRGMKLSDGTTTWEKDSEAKYAGTFAANEDTLPQVLAERKFTLWIQSPYATDSIKNGLYQQIYQLPTLTYNCEWIGNPAIEIGDNIHINEFITEGTTVDLYVNIGAITLKYDGGLSGVLSGIGEGKQRNQFATNGDIASAIEVVQADVAEVVTTVETVQSDVATVQTDVSTLQDDVATLVTDVATANTNAANALTAANGKNKIYYQATAPTGTFSVGDTWFDIDDDHKPYRWNGTSWTGLAYGMNALGELSASKITSGTIDASVITVNNLNASKITSGTMSADRISGGTITTNSGWTSDSGLSSAIIELLRNVIRIRSAAASADKLELFASSTSGTIRFKVDSNSAGITMSDSVITLNASTIQTGNSESGRCGCGARFQPTATGQPIASQYVQFKVKKSYTPSSITLTAEANNADSVASAISVDGFYLTVNSSNTNLGLHYWRGTYSA